MRTKSKNKTSMLDFTDFLAMMAIEDAHEEYEREREKEQDSSYSSDESDDEEREDDDSW